MLPGLFEELKVRHPPAAGSSQLILTKKLLLDRFIDRWFTRQVDKARRSHHDYLEDPGALLGDDAVEELKTKHPLDWETRCLKQSYWLFCQELASHLQAEKRTSVVYPPLPHTVGSPAPEAWIIDLLDPDNPDLERCRRGSPLRRTMIQGSGRDKPVSIEYSFLHPLLIDYFVATMDTPETQAVVEPELKPESPAPPSIATPLSSALAQTLYGSGDVSASATSKPVTATPPVPS